jgi:hypothetical protein
MTSVEPSAMLAGTVAPASCHKPFGWMVSVPPAGARPLNVMVMLGRPASFWWLPTVLGSSPADPLTVSVRLTCAGACGTKILTRVRGLDISFYTSSRFPLHRR